MTVTRKSFQGQPEEERQWIEPGDPSESSETLIKTMTGAAAMQSGISKGNSDGMSGPGNDATPPRSLYSAQVGSDVVNEGLDSSTGAAGPFPAGPQRQTPPKSTGAGSGSKTIKTYGPGGVGAPAGLTTPGGNQGRNTG